MKTLAATVLLACCAGLAFAEARHPCAGDAIKRATPLLTLHFNDGANDKPQNLSIDDRVRVLPSIRALKGKGRFDVLEVTGHVYKADYRMRFIYARAAGDCLLMGQEILEASDPY